MRRFEKKILKTEKLLLKNFSDTCVIYKSQRRNARKKQILDMLWFKMTELKIIHNADSLSICLFLLVHD